MTEVSARAWSELLHAEVGYLLRRAGVPCLHIKGPSVVQWLYAEGERPWGDVDVMVPPERLDDALAALLDSGFSERHPGVTAANSGDHAVTLAQPAGPGGPLFEVDVHHRFEGIEADPGLAFAELWRRREPARLGHVEVWLPDLATRALLVCLNTARNPVPQAREDLRRLCAAGRADDWAALVDLAARVEARAALRAGLELDPLGAEVVAHTDLLAVEVTPEWRLRLARAPRTALRLEELRRLGPHQRASTVLRWLVPAPAVIRMRDPRAAGGPLALAQAYVRRWAEGLSTLPPALRALGRARPSRDPKR